MSKTKKKTSKNSALKGSKIADADKPKPTQQTEMEEQDDFDFGGLPKRDLKKNLGCG